MKDRGLVLGVIVGMVFGVGLGTTGGGHAKPAGGLPRIGGPIIVAPVAAPAPQSSPRPAQSASPPGTR